MRPFELLEPTLESKELAARQFLSMGFEFDRPRKMSSLSSRRDCLGYIKATKVLNQPFWRISSILSPTSLNNMYVRAIGLSFLLALGAQGAIIDLMEEPASAVERDAVLGDSNNLEKRAFGGVNQPVVS